MNDQGADGHAHCLGSFKCSLNQCTSQCTGNINLDFIAGAPNCHDFMVFNICGQFENINVYEKCLLWQSVMPRREKFYVSVLSRSLDGIRSVVCL